MVRSDFIIYGQLALSDMITVTPLLYTSFCTIDTCFGNKKLEGPGLGALLTLLFQPWMLPDIALAKRAQPVFSGSSMDQEIFERLLPIVGYPSFFQFILSVIMGYEIHRPIVRLGNATIMRPHQCQVQKQVYITIDETLSFTVSLESTNPCDGICALLGLLTDGSIYRLKPQITVSLCIKFPLK